MAAWQYTFYIVPRFELERKYKRIPSSIEESFLEETAGWKDVSPAAFNATLAKSFGPERLLSYGPVIFGEEDSSCVKLLFNGTVLEEVTVRLDLRKPVKKQIKDSIQLCKSLNGTIVTTEFQVIDCFEDALTKSIKASKSLEFVKNPSSFLDSLK